MRNEERLEKRRKIKNIKILFILILSDQATDSDYEYSLEGDKLHLKGLNNYAGEYELEKQK